MSGLGTSWPENGNQSETSRAMKRQKREPKKGLDRENHLGGTKTLDANTQWDGKWTEMRSQERGGWKESGRVEGD